MADIAAAHRHRLFVERVLRLMDGKPIVETMTAMQTVVGLTLVDAATDAETALGGFEAWAADVREFIGRACANKTTAH